MDSGTPGAALTDGVVRLRVWDPEDAGWYATAALDPAIQRFTSEPATLTADQVRAALRQQVERDDIASFVICDAATGKRLGNIGMRYTDGIGDVSYWLAAPARGRGVATRAVRLLSQWGFDHLRLAELRLWTYVDNVASRRVAERAGYRRDPGRDEVRQVKGVDQRTVAYRLLPDLAGEAE